MTRQPKPTPHLAYQAARPQSAAKRSQAGSNTKSRVPLVDPARFLQATRDAGYRSPSNAIAELLDNSLQADAQRVDIRLITPSGRGERPEVLVIDDGHGMEPEELELSLSFGGSTRFDDRQGLGRYGMGLPNASLSIAKRVDVYTWRAGKTHTTALDLDRFVTDGHKTLGRLERIRHPSFLPETAHGTAIHLTKCDRLGYKRLGFLRRKLHLDFGRAFRHFIAQGRTLSIDSERVTAIDPLFLMASSQLTGARQFGDILSYSMQGTGSPGEVTVRFSELPIEEWHRAPSKEKRRLGISNASTVSILRANREIDAGWFFMGGKRRENYDDWWRCEITFDPHLDEAFGVTHTKQGIRPSRELVDLLSRDLEPIARALSKRVRNRFEAVKASSALTKAESRAEWASSALPRLPDRCDEFPEGFEPVPYIGSSPKARSRYRIRVTDLEGTNAYATVLHEGNVLLLLNRRHPLYRDIYSPLAEWGGDSDDNPLVERFALMLLALGHAEGATTDNLDRAAIGSFLQRWDDVLATFLQ